MTGRRRRLLPAVLLAAVLLPGCASSSGGSSSAGRPSPSASPSPSPSPLPSPQPISALKPRVAAVVQTGGDPDWMVVTEGSLFLAVGAQHEVVRVSEATNKIVAHIPVGQPCAGMAATAG